MRQVEVQRRDRDETALHRFEVRVLPRLPRRWIATNPVILPAARIEAFDDAFAVDALAETCDFHALEADREIDVENDVDVPLALQDDACELTGERGAGGEREVF